MRHRPESTAARQRTLSVIVVHDFAAATGGAERVAILEAAGLARRGHRVTLVAGDGEPDSQLVDAGVDVRTTGQRPTLVDPNRLRAAARGVWNRRAAALVEEVAAVADPDTTVVHVHGFTKVLSASVVHAATQSGLPTVATMHDYFAACPNGGFFNYRRSEVCALTPLTARCIATNCDARRYSHKLWRVGRAAVQRHVGAMPGGVGDLIAPSRIAAETLRPFLPPESRVHVLPNPVHVSREPPADVSQNAPFVFVGRLDRDKGPLVLANAARRAHVHAVFVGAGEQAEAVCRAYPAAEVTGWLEPDHVRSAMRGARAIVSTSLWYETQGLSVLEAAANGVPAIVPDTSVLTEIVADWETGLWFRGGDADHLAEKLTALRHDPQLASRLGGGAYDRFWSGRWDPDTHLDRLEAVYRGALRR